MRKWGRTLQLYWCPTCNVPLRQRICDRCGGEGFKVSIAEPGDLRPALDCDLKLILNACVNEFGSDVVARRLLVDGAVYLNKTPHYDDMREVISGGTIVGRVYFDPKTYRWRWRLNKLSAEVAIEEGLVKTFRVNHVKPLMDLGPYEGGCEQAVVLNNKGEPTALAIERKGRFRVQSIFKESIRNEVIRKPSSFILFKKCNSLWYRSRLSKAHKSLVTMYEKTRLKPVVSYSGGKDSLVALSIALDSGIEPEVIFNDTGIELPETISNVNEVSRYFNIEVITASAGERFWRAVKVFGPPARDYRWCCKVVKMAPIARLYKNRYPSGLLAIIGQRAFESIDRSRSGYVWRNRWLPSALNVAPLQEWDQLSVWTYVFERGLPINELYMRGFERIGCYLCPAGNIAEYHFVETEFPDIWGRWRVILEKWRERLGEDRLWLRYHLWRWLNPLSQGRRRLESWLGIKRPRSWLTLYRRFSGIKLVLAKDEEGFIKLKLEPSIDLRIVKEEASVVKARDLRIEKGVVVINIDGNEVRLKPGEVITSGSLKVLSKLLKIALRRLYCCGCSLCVIWCPTGAIKVMNSKPIIDESKCVGCESCLEVCPISKIFVEKLLITQLLETPKVREEGVPLILAIHRLKRARVGEEEKGRYSLDSFTDFLNLK